MKRLLLALAALSLLTQGATAVIHSEDFATDPFSARWTKTTTSGYSLQWTGTNPSTIGPELPTELGNPLDAIYAFSDGVKNAWTTDITNPSASSQLASPGPPDHPSSLSTRKTTGRNPSVQQAIRLLSSFIHPGAKVPPFSKVRHTL